MSTLRSIISCDLSCRHRLTSQSSVRNQHRLFGISTTPTSEDGCSFLVNNRSGLSLLSIKLGSESKSNAKMNMAVYCSPQPPISPSTPWKGWILGVLLMVILPFCKKKWGSIIPIKREVDKVLEEAEKVADVVEKVAEEVEKVAEEVEKVADKVADEFPEAGKVIHRVEVVAKEAAKDAEAVEEVIQKVEEVEQEVEKEMESATAPAANKENVVPKENMNESKL